VGVYVTLIRRENKVARITPLHKLPCLRTSNNPSEDELHSESIALSIKVKF
jgi:hypothetical protein